MTDSDLYRAIVEGVIEDAVDLQRAKDYRTLNASSFFAKYRLELADEGRNLEKFLESIDAGIETLDWTS